MWYSSPSPALHVLPPTPRLVLTAGGERRAGRRVVVPANDTRGSIGAGDGRSESSCHTGTTHQILLCLSWVMTIVIAWKLLGECFWPTPAGLSAE